MARLIALAGLPGVGKSSIARHLARRFGAIWLRIDSTSLNQTAPNLAQFHPYAHLNGDVCIGSMLLKNSAPCHPLATISSPALASCIYLAPSMLVLNQYCSQVPFKILFQQHRSNSERLTVSTTSPVYPRKPTCERTSLFDVKCQHRK